MNSSTISEAVVKQPIDNMGVLGCLLGGLELTRRCLCYISGSYKEIEVHGSWRGDRPCLRSALAFGRFIVYDIT